MVLITDVDLYALKDLHEYGTVKTLKDRRHDMYRVMQLNVATVEKPKESLQKNKDQPEFPMLFRQKKELIIDVFNDQQWLNVFLVKKENKINKKLR